MEVDISEESYYHKSETLTIISTKCTFGDSVKMSEWVAKDIQVCLV